MLGGIDLDDKSKLFYTIELQYPPISVAPALRIELRPDDLESPALTFTLHRIMQNREVGESYLPLSNTIIQYYLL